jgi:hypothetical protein
MPDYVGLLLNGPPSEAGLPFNQSPNRIEDSSVAARPYNAPASAG